MENFRVEVKVSFAKEGHFFGPGTNRLLKKIRESGSVSEACKACNMSYSKGWKLLKASESELGEKLVERKSGGKGGGDAVVTPLGEELISKYEEAVKSIKKFAGTLSV